MQKKDYVRAAELLNSNQSAVVEKREIAYFLCRLFSENPKFNKEKFLKACMVS